MSVRSATASPRARRRGAGRWQRVQAVATDVGTAIAARAVAAVLFLGLAGYGLTYGAGELQAVLFRRNPRYMLRRLDIQSGPTMTPEDVRQVANIREGMNLFALDLPRIRNSFLRNLPSVRDIHLERRLPDELRIAVHEREPIARLGRSGRVVTDFDGHLFVVRAAQQPMTEALPVLVSEEWAGLSPGQRLGERSRQALTVLDVAQVLSLSFRIAAFDTTGPHYLVLLTTDRQEIELPWPALRDRAAVTQMLTNVCSARRDPLAAGRNRFIASPSDNRVIARYN